MKKIAVLGSRKFPAPDTASVAVIELREKYGLFVLVSGNADGPSKRAEQTALELGLPVLSFRAVKISGGGEIEDEFGVDEWRLFNGTGKIIRHTHPTWATWEGALFFRSALIAERADEGIAFWDGYSRGTSHEIDLFAAEKKTLEVIRPE